MAIYEMGPGAAAIEYFVVNWMLEKIGWTPAPLEPGRWTEGTFGGGVLTHGGSLANLTALIAARSAVRPDAWRQGNPGDLAVMVSGTHHYRIERAVGILGLGTRNLYDVPTDARGAMDPRALPPTLARLRADGKTPLALVANACSTAVGVYDRLRPLGEFCRDRDLWFHVDGAHGAAALLSPAYRHRLDGVELASSLTWDAHKMMRTSSVCAALLVRDHRTLDAAFQQEASYLFHDKEQPGFDFLHRAVECTKSGLGLRFYWVLAALGEEGLARYVERQYRLAARAYDDLQGLGWVETPVAPESNILCFRVRGSDARQLDLRKRILAAGDFYLTSTQFQDRRYLRLVFMNPDTTLDDVERLTEQIRRFGTDGPIAWREIEEHRQEGSEASKCCGDLPPSLLSTPSAYPTTCEIVAVSAGFDRRERDWGGLLATPGREDYRAIGESVEEHARLRCQGRRFGVLEGGYNHAVLGRNVESFLQGSSD
ncbi:MAG: pyridoxal-dependent decarboxylase [Candidatus Contendobacter sp.]|nr:pyridoxal-dependent decarboxylase [Candidatus Contendobacter sp.]